MSKKIHLKTLLKLYEAAQGSQTKVIDLTDIVAYGLDPQIEADYMNGEGWIELIGDNGPPWVRLSHLGISTAESLIDGESENPKDTFPHVSLFPGEREWLKGVYDIVRKGNIVDRGQLTVALWDRLPKNFSYNTIDRRLLINGGTITLLGIIHIEPNTDMVEILDSVITCIRRMILQNPAIKEITTEQVAEETGTLLIDVSFAFELLGCQGKFWNQIRYSKSGYKDIVIDDELIKREYLSYDNIVTSFKKYYDKQEHSEMSTTIENVAIQDPRAVFVIHGRNEAARSSLFEFLRSLDLRPQEWSELVRATGKGTPYVGDVLDVAFSKAMAIVVLMTPDDEARLSGPLRNANDRQFESQLTGQPRQNVLYEAGMAMGRNPKRTIIVELGKLRPFSDALGRHVIRLTNTSSSRQDLADRLQTAGCSVNLGGRDWHTAGDFTLFSSSP